MTEFPCESGARRLLPPPRLTRRAEFLAAAKGKRYQSRSFSLQAGRQALRDGDISAIAGHASSAPRFGFTVTKKIGNAVVRNRIRRRLKEALRLASDLPVRPGYDYVIVARLSALNQSFPALQDELRRAIGGIHETRRPGGDASKDKSRPAAAPTPVERPGSGDE